MLDFGDWLKGVLNDILPCNYLMTMFPDRPYDGQPHTDDGIRGKTEVRGLTMRDIRDCYIRACFESSGLPRERWPRTIYELPWHEMDPMAIAQNLTCEIEMRMGIFPNVPPLKTETTEEADDDA